MDTVNPKFRWFDKPVLLAIIVGTCTAAVTAVLFVIAMAQCSDHTEALMYADHVFHESSMESWADSKPGLSCIYLGELFFAEDGGKTDTVACAPPLPAGVVRCSEPSSAMVESIRVQDKGLDVWEVFETVPVCNEEGTYQWWAARGNSGRWASWMKPMVEYKVCPDAYTTFGASLGNAGLIEVAFTMLFVGVLQATGVLKGKSHSAVGQWLIQSAKESMKSDVELRLDELEKQVKELTTGPSKDADQSERDA